MCLPGRHLQSDVPTQLEGKLILALQSITMPTTRAQEAAEKRELRAGTLAEDNKPVSGKPVSKAKKPASSRKPASTKKSEPVEGVEDEPSVTVGKKREADGVKEELTDSEQPPAKKTKTRAEEHAEEQGTTEKEHPPLEGAYQTGAFFVHSPHLQYI